MKLSDEVLEQLRARLSKETQTSVAKQTGISQPYLNQLNSGACEIENMKFGFFEKLFPHATINFQGKTQVINAPKNSGNVVGINHGVISNDCLSRVMDKILESADLSAEEKIKFLTVLKK